MSNGTVEILGGRERRRRWSLEEKLRIVAESHEAGSSVRAVAARNDVYPSLLHNWRRQAQEGRLAARPPARFMPVRLPASAQRAEVATPPAKWHSSPETIEIELPDGCRLRVGNGVSAAQLRRVITALRG
jgi:transposase